MDNPKPKPKRSKRRRILWRLAVAAALFPIVLVVAVVFAAPRVANMESVREALGTLVEDQIGLPTVIGAIDLQLFPGLVVTAREVQVGEGDFVAEIPSAFARGSLSDLLRRHVYIPHIESKTLIIRTPEKINDVADRIQGIVDAVTPTEPIGPSAWTVTIDRIQLDRAEIQRGADSEKKLFVTVTLKDVVSERLLIDGSVEAPYLGPDARLETDIAILLPSGAPFALHGTAAAHAIYTDRLPIENAPEGVLNVKADMNTDGPEAWMLTTQSTFDAPKHPALEGAFALTGRWEGGNANIESATWEAPGVQLAANGTYNKAGDFGAHISSATVSDAALASLVDMAVFDAARLAKTDDASLHAAELDLGRDADGALHFNSGTVAAKGFVLASKEGDVIVDGIHIELTLEEDRIRIDRCVADGIEISGHFRPDWVNETASVDLAARIDLRPEFLGLAGLTGVETFSGAVEFTKIAGVFGGKEIVGDGLEVIGAWKDGEFRYHSDEIDEDVTDIQLAFDVADSNITTRLQAQSALTGPVEIDGRFAVDDRAWTGTANVDFVHIINAFLDPKEGDPIETALAAYVPAPLTLGVYLPSEDREGIRITASRLASPPIEASTTFTRDGGSWTLGAIDGSGTYPAGSLADEVLADTHIDGDAQWTFARHADSGAFEARVDLTQSGITVGPRVKKTAGQILNAAIHGQSKENWLLDRVELALLSESLTFKFVNGDIELAPHEIDLDELDALLVGDSSIGGKVKIQLASEPRKMDAMFDGCSLTVESGASIEGLNGRVLYEEDRLSLDGIIIRTAGADCVVNATHEHGRWDGSIKGDALDMNAIEKTVETILAAAPKPDELADPPPAKPIMLAEDIEPGRFTIDIGKVMFHRATFTDVRATAESDKNGIRIRDINITPYSGAITGRVDVSPNANREAILRITIDAKQADSRFMDEIVYAETHDMKGPWDAKIQFTGPLYDDYKAVLAHGDGIVNINGVNGSLGEFGIATDIMRVLRTSRIINLKAPKLREQGLAYDTFTVSANLTAGVLTFSIFDIDGGSYFIQGEGFADFAQETMNVKILTRVLESVGNVLKRVPLLGNSIKRLTTDIVAVYIGVTGSPYDPQVSSLGETGAGMVTGIFKAVGDVVTPEKQN